MSGRDPCRPDFGFGSTKSHATRRVPLPRSLVVDLAEHLERLRAHPDALVFTSPEGAPLRHSTFRQRGWLPALERAGVPPVGIHVLRHSAAAAMIRARATPKELQVVLGHASAAFSLTQYGHIFDADLDRVADRPDALVDPATGQGRDKAGSRLVQLRTRKAE